MVGSGKKAASPGAVALHNPAFTLGRILLRLELVHKLVIAHPLRDSQNDKLVQAPARVKDKAHDHDEDHGNHNAA